MCTPTLALTVHTNKQTIKTSAGPSTYLVHEVNRSRNSQAAGTPAQAATERWPTSAATKPNVDLRGQHLIAVGIRDSDVPSLSDTMLGLLCPDKLALRVKVEIKVERICACGQGVIIAAVVPAHAPSSVPLAAMLNRSAREVCA